MFDRRLRRQLDDTALDVARLLGTGSGGNFDDGIATVERAGIDAENASHAAHHFGALPFGQKKTEALGFRF
jgi:hypothetical protein